jgi:hypothetical protein
MQRRPFFIWICLLFLTALGGAEGPPSLIVGGESAGPFKVGASFKEVTQVLGSPDSSTPTSADPSTSLKMYKSKQLAFLVNKESKVIGITVARKDWKTARGLGVGSPLLAFQETFGKGLKRGSGQIAFPESGLAVTYSGGYVKTVYVVKKDELDAVKGDYLLVGGTRAGQLRLGRSSQDLLKLLGNPPQKEGQGNNIWVYPDQGIRLGFIQGRLHMVGVTSGEWVTPSGLKVGRPFSEMKRELGSKYRVESSSVFFDQWGIGARLAGDQIVELLIFNPKKSNRQG